MAEHAPILASTPTAHAAAQPEHAVGEAMLEREPDAEVQHLSIQCKLSVGSPNDPLEEEADSMANKVMRMPENSFIQRKCAHCEEKEKESEKVQRKPLTAFIQKKSLSDIVVATDAVSNRIESARGHGQLLEPAPRSFMENRFGADFSDVRIHANDEAAQLCGEFKAQAFTVGNDIYLNEGKYAPETDSGKHLLAHELTHVIQQNGNESVQRKAGDIAIEPTRTFANEERSIGYLFKVYDLLETSVDLQQVLVINGRTAKFYDVTRNDTGFKKTNPATYHLKKLNLPPYFLVGLPNAKFGIVGVQDIDMGNNNNNVSTVLIGGKSNTDEEKKIFEQIDKELTLPDWFLYEKEREDFSNKLNRAFGFAVIILSSGGGAGSKAEGGEGEGEARPAMPDWMGPYRAAMKKLIEAARAAEPKAIDLPDKFYLYFSSSKNRWRAGASQLNGEPPKKLDVNFDIKYNDDKNEKLQQIRDKIRIRQLHIPSDGNKDDEPKDASLEWAFRIKYEIDAKIGEARETRPDAADLPDKTGVTTKIDSPNTAYLKLFVSVPDKDEEGNATNALKSGTMATPLVRGVDLNELFTAVRNATKALRGGEIKQFDDNAKKYKNTLMAFPASIEGLNIRDDYVSVTGAQLEMFMNLNTGGVPGMSLLTEAATHFRGIVYSWDVYRVSEVVPEAELSKLPKAWKERRNRLQGLFKNSGQLKEANPVFNGGLNLKMDLAPLAPRDINFFRSLGLTYGLKPSYDSTGTLKMPGKEGEYVIYCRAVVEPSEETYRLPSEAFFAVDLVDGYKLATGIRDERTNEIERTKKQINQEVDEKKQNALKEKLDELQKQETGTLNDNTTNSIEKQKELIFLSEKLLSFYRRANANKRVTDQIVQEAEDEKIDDKQFDMLLELWKYVETTELEKEPAEKLTKIIEDGKKTIKQMNDVFSRISMFDEDLKGYDIQPAPVVGLVSRVTGQAYPLLLTLGIGTSRLGTRTHAMLVDVTTHETQEKYEGQSDIPINEGGYEEAVRNAFILFGEKCAYGEGYIAYRVPGKDKAKGQIESAPGTWEKVKHVLTIVAAVAGIAALIVGSIFTGGALAVVAGYVGIGSMLVGAALAVDSIYDRAVNHRIHADVELAMDILNIAGPVLQGAGALAKLSKVSTLRTIVNAAETAGDISAGEKGFLTVAMLNKLENIIMLEKTLMVIQKGEAITNLGLIGYKTYKDLAMVAEVYAGDPKKMAAMQAEIMKNAVIAGTFAIVALKSEFKMRNIDEIDALANNLTKQRDYENAMVRSGLKDLDGNWRDPKLKEYFLGKAKEESAHPTLPESEKNAQAVKPQNERPADEPLGKHESDTYEKERQVEMKGHEKTPDKEHDVEVYKDGEIGRCSSTVGEKCPILQLEFKETLEARPMIKKELADMQNDLKKYGENVPGAKLKALAKLEQRLRTVELAARISKAPKDYKIKEVSYDFLGDLPLVNEKMMLEYPGGERVWRDGNGIHHEAAIRPSVGRQGYERDFYSASESGLLTYKGTERAHSFGQGFGWESPFALYQAPRFVNQRLQNNGIEQYVRTMRDLVLHAGQKVVVHTTTAAKPRSRKLENIKYEGFILTPAGEKILAFKYEINVQWKKDSGSVVKAQPIEFVNSSNAGHQKVIDDFKGLLPASKMPEPITQNINQDISYP